MGTEIINNDNAQILFKTIDLIYLKVEDVIKIQETLYKVDQVCYDFDGNYLMVYVETYF